MSQEQVAAAEHITLSGTAVCTDCTGTLLVRVQQFMEAPDGTGEEEPPPPDPNVEAPGPLTTVTLTEAGAFSIKVPKGDGKVVIELLLDEDGNGMPSKGERMAMHDGGPEGLVPSGDADGIRLDASDRDWEPPKPGGPPPDETVKPGGQAAAGSEGHVGPNAPKLGEGVGSEGEAAAPPVEGEAAAPPVEGEAAAPPVEGEAAAPPAGDGG